MRNLKKTLAALTFTTIVGGAITQREGYPEHDDPYATKVNLEIVVDSAIQSFDSLKIPTIDDLNIPYEVDMSETAKSLRKLPKHVFYFKHKDQFTKDSLALINIVNNIDLYSEVVTKELIISLINAESNFFLQPKISKAGARGPIQVMRNAWETVETDPYLPNVDDPKRNILAGVKICRWLENYCSNYNPRWDKSSLQRKRDLIVAAYNCGIGTLVAYEEVQLAKKDSTYVLLRHPWYIDETPEETRNHVVKVRNTLNQILKNKEQSYLAYK